MALGQQVLNRLENGDTDLDLARQVLQQMGFTAYVAGGVTCGWLDPLSGKVLLVGKHNVSVDHALSFLPPGWAWSTTQNAQGRWIARVAPTQGQLAAATPTKASGSEAIALFVAIAVARAA